LPPDPPAATPNVVTIPEAAKKRQQESSPGEDAVNHNQMADFSDKDAKAAEISEEGLEPHNLAGAEPGLDGLLRDKAIAEELATLKEAGTWEMTDTPEGADVVGSKWILWATKDPATSLVCCKDHLVAPLDIFVPDARLSSILVVLANAAARDYCISQINIEGIYTNEILTSNEAMPPGLSSFIPNPFGKIIAGNPRKTFYRRSSPRGGGTSGW